MARVDWKYTLDFIMERMSINTVGSRRPCEWKNKSAGFMRQDFKQTRGASARSCVSTPVDVSSADVLKRSGRLLCLEDHFTATVLYTPEEESSSENSPPDLAEHVAASPSTLRRSFKVEKSNDRRESPPNGYIPSWSEYLHAATLSLPKSPYYVNHRNTHDPLATSRN